jgi:hypothetical protein
VAEENVAGNGETNTGEEVQLTPEQQALADKYRAQFAEANPAGNPNAAEKPAEGEGEKNKPTRPEHIPEKFWDAEKGEVRVDELAKSYTELERKKAEQPKPKEGEEAKPGENGEGEQEIAHAEALKEFRSLRDQATELLSKGEPLTDDIYAKMEKAVGLTRDDVDAFIAGQQALGQLAKYQVHTEAGGEDRYKAMIDWARANYSPEEVQVYDRDIHSGDPNVRLAAVRGLKARFAQANGEEGRSVTNGGNGNRAFDGYESGAQMRADMRDPRYKKDSAFRAEVARKVAAARAAGIDLALT